jgi:hypothetical protein
MINLEITTTRGIYKVSINPVSRDVVCTHDLLVSGVAYRCYYNLNREDGVRTTKGRTVGEIIISDILTLAGMVKITYVDDTVRIYIDGHHPVAINVTDPMSRYTAVPIVKWVIKLQVVVSVIVSIIIGFFIFADQIYHGIMQYLK